MLKDKVAIVTGGSRGIGAQTAKALAKEGASIAVIYAHGAEKAEAVCKECEALYGVSAKAYGCNVADFDAVKKTVAAIKKDGGSFHILVKSAGITRDKLAMMMSEDDFDSVIDTNLKGTFNMIRHCASTFVRNKGGAIVNVASVVGLCGNPGQANYSASKAGVIGLTKTMAKELAAKNIRVNAVAPGFIATDMTKDLQSADEWMKNIPLHRAGTAEEVAEAIVFLTKAAYITGEVLKIDGGMAI